MQSAGTLCVAPSVELIERLRGSIGLRPVVDRNLAPGLRAWLADGIHGLLGRRRSPELRLTSADVAPGAGSASQVAVLRGSLVAYLVTLHASGVEVRHPMQDAVAAMEASGQEGRRLRQIAELGDDDRARLGCEVAGHDEVLRGALGGFPARWSPRCGTRLSVPLCGGQVICSGRVDLSLGTRGGTHAGTCLVDVTTSPLEERHEALCRYLALLETLRTAEQPLRVAVLSTADGACLVEDVDEGLLADAVADLIDAVGRAAAAT